jgi:hypothetical protein
MAGDEGVFADAPVVIDEVDVGVADAAVRDLDLDIIGCKFCDLVLKGQQLSTGRVGGQSLDLCHGGNADAAFTFEITTALAGKICFVWKHGPGLWDNQQAPLVGRTPHRSISLDRRRHLKAMGPLAPPSGPLCLKTQVRRRTYAVN